MSSRAASGRKRLRPAQTATPSLSALPESIQPGNAVNRRDIGSKTQPASPQAFRTPTSTPSLSPSPSTLSSSSGFSSPRQFPPQSQASRDHMQRSQWPEGAGELTPYPLPSQIQTYQPPQMRKDRSAQFRTANPSPESPTLHPAPSYNTFSSTYSSDSEAADNSRRSSGARALPPYPNPPSTKTGWAALSDTKVASARAVPPRYPEDAQRQKGMNPYPSPPLSWDSQTSVAHSESMGSSSSRLPTTPERTERARSGSQPPHYSPPRQLPTAPGAISPPEQNRFPTNHSHDAAYPTPQASSFSSPSTSLASLPSTSAKRLHRNGSNLSGSSGSTSGGSLAHSARTGNPAMESAQSVSTSSSSGRSVISGSPPTTPSALAPTPPNAPFVFPSSRSRARPNNTTPGVSRFKFRGRRKLKAPMANVQVLAPGTPIPAEGIFTAQPSPLTPPQPASPTDANFRMASPPQNLRLTPTMSVGSGSSGSSGTPATPTFYFPSSRTRAHPKAPTQFALGKATKPGFPEAWAEKQEGCHRTFGVRT
ncbi:hypothetical protein MVEN_01569600 [Mycena venus]|uniref:Uncharacterized protein n=1 Tax=Mycena venus TaxID=2733690 RepID=A0A8H6XRZ9_9AGAR|nr:hypothetical protein MVEN_01569600 [Mycena venus]